MLYVCLSIVRCGALGARVWELLLFLVVQMLYVCVLCASCGSSQYCMTCNLLILVEDARDTHMEEVYSRPGLMSAL